jgi:hypothetical protein
LWYTILVPLTIEALAAIGRALSHQGEAIMLSCLADSGTLDENKCVYDDAKERGWT